MPVTSLRSRVQRD